MADIIMAVIITTIDIITLDMYTAMIIPTITTTITTHQDTIDIIAITTMDITVDHRFVLALGFNNTLL